MKTCPYCGKEYPDEATVCERDGMNLASENPPTQVPPPATLAKKQEIKVLREIVQTYQNCPERVAAYNRRKWVSTWTAWLLIFTAVLLSRIETVSSILCCVVALLGGVSLGFAITLSSAAAQAPLVVRFTTLHEDEIQKRLKELA
jgi:hypothetical protein